METKSKLQKELFREGSLMSFLFPIFCIFLAFLLGALLAKYVHVVSFTLLAVGFAGMIFLLVIAIGFMVKIEMKRIRHRDNSSHSGSTLHHI